MVRNLAVYVYKISELNSVKREIDEVLLERDNPNLKNT
jgi:hypothetical protein